MKSIFRRTNKKYGYQPRYYKGKHNPYEIGHMFDDQRHTAHQSRGLLGKWYSAMFDAQTEGDRKVWLRLGLISAVLILIVLFILDFDLTIFLR